MKEYRITKCDTDKIDISDVKSFSEKIKEIQGNMFTYKIGNEKYLSILFTDNCVKIFFDYNSLILIGKDLINLEPTDILRNMLDGSNEKAHEMAEGISYYALLSYKLFTIFSLNQTKKKVIKSALYQKVKLPKYSLEYKLYEYDIDKDYFAYSQNNDCVDLLIYGDNSRTVYSFPSAMYPMSSNDISVYTSKNTKELEDDNELSEILETLTYKLGDCHNISMMILEKLREVGYTKKHKVERKVGWLSVFTTPPQYHAFIVIDDCYVIDDTRVAGLNCLYNEMKKLRQGYDVKEYNRVDVLNIFKESSKLSFSERGTYGKVKDYAFYIGCTNEERNETKFVHSMLDRFPNHPAFNNYANTGKTVLQEMARLQGF